MELEAEVERQLQIVVAERVLDEGGEPRCLLCGPGGETASARGAESIATTRSADRPRRRQPLPVSTCFFRSLAHLCQIPGKAPSENARKAALSPARYRQNLPQ